nr:lipoprotein [Streptomyces sp. SID5470]
MTPSEAVAKAAEDSADITSLRYRITGSVPDQGQLTVDAAMSTAPLSMTMELTMADQRAKGPLSIRFAGKAMYVGGGALDIRKLGRSANLDPDKLNGKSWLRIEPAAWGLISVDNQSYGVLPHQVEGSPIVQSTLLTGAKNAKKIGAETILGARTTHYRGTVTFDGLRAAQDAATDKASRERQTRSLDQFIALELDKNLIMDLWIDDDGRTRQFRMRGATYKMPVKAGEEPTVGDPVDMTVAFLRINEPVTVTTPSAGDTTDVGALLDAQTG